MIVQQLLHLARCNMRYWCIVSAGLLGFTVFFFIFSITLVALFYVFYAREVSHLMHFLCGLFVKAWK